MQEMPETKIIQYEQDDDTDEDFARASGQNILQNVIEEEKLTLRSTKKKK